MSFKSADLPPGAVRWQPGPSVSQGSPGTMRGPVPLGHSSGPSILPTIRGGCVQNLKASLYRLPWFPRAWRPGTLDDVHAAEWLLGRPRVLQGCRVSPSSFCFGSPQNTFPSLLGTESQAPLGARPFLPQLRGQVGSSPYHPPCFPRCTYDQTWPFNI